MKISICIPTFNRAAHLANCLQSIASNQHRAIAEFEVCVSDNCSSDDTEKIVRQAQSYLPIKYHRNTENLGIPRNFLNVIDMASGEFVWLIGDDDLLMPNAIDRIINQIETNSHVDYFFVNSCHLTTDYVLSFPQPFDTRNLPVRMTPFSSWAKSGEINFIDLIDPKISFDFLGGMYLSVFRRSKWMDNVDVLSQSAISDTRTFSHFDNTFPHVKIFAAAFSKSKAFIVTEPLSVCLTGAREWAPMYPMVRSVRLVQALDEYRRNGLSRIRYLRCRNFALRNFAGDFARMLVTRKTSGLAYVNPVKLMLSNCLYPNFYGSIFRTVVRNCRKIQKRVMA